jgi:protein-tyrosine phosphatase
MTGHTMDRRVELGGVYNVRDLGGVPTLDGRLVRRGQIFRASSLHRLTDEEAWREFGAATVIDLRYQKEIDAFPLPEFIEDATHAPVLPEGWQRGREDRRPEGDAAEHLAWVYEVMLEMGQDTVRRILTQLAEAESTPAVFFCMAGKDRTGFVAAVLLSLLGVSDDVIADDFALSGEEVVALVEWLRTREDFENHPMMNQSEELLRAPRGAMELFLARVTAEYGSLHDWVLTLDLPAGTVDILRERLLVDTTDDISTNDSSTDDREEP